MGPEANDDREVTAKRLYEALAQGDERTISALLHPEFRGETTEGLPFGLGGSYTGAQDMIHEFWWAVGRYYRARAEPERFLPADDDMIVLGRYTGTARDGGGRLDAAFAHVLTFEDERIRSLRQYTDSARWFAPLSPAPAGRRRLRVVRYVVGDGVATIELNRPETGNAINPAMVEDLDEATFRASTDPSVRAVLVRGAGGTLSVGGDLSFFAEAGRDDLPLHLRQMIDHYHLALERLAAMAAPVVCAVRGAAAGGGMGLAHVSDIVVAAEDSRFRLGYSTIGLASDGANSWYLPRVVGLRRAQQMFLLNRTLSGREALDWGLVSEVVCDEQVDDRARELALDLATGPTAAFGRMKHLLRHAHGAELSDQLIEETRHMSAAGASEDAPEGIAAFVERRAPRFGGG